MGRLHRIGNVEVRVYANDHLPPHFHIVGPNAEALIEIATLAVLRGDVGKGNGKAILAWAKANRAAIAAEWNRINPRFPTARGDAS